MDGLINGKKDGLVNEHQCTKRGYNPHHFPVVFDNYQLKRTTLTIVMLVNCNSRGKCS